MITNEAKEEVVNEEAVSSANDQQTQSVFLPLQWEEIMEEIMEALKDDRINLVGFHGKGGVGKSTMINVVHSQVKRQCTFDEVVKVDLKFKSEIRRIQEEIAFALDLKFENERLAIRGNQLRERLLLKSSPGQKGKNVLIILDDVCEKLDLEKVGIPLCGNDQVHVKLLLISRDERLLSNEIGASKSIYLYVLSDADAVRMFKFFVGVGAECVDPEIVTEIATKCSGLPIVIVPTAKALKNKALGEWEKIRKRLDNVYVLDKLKVSYDYLPSKESKELFLICGLISGSRIQVWDILKYIFGLQLYNRKDRSTLVAAAAKLEKMLAGLEAASMLLNSDDNGYVKIHDLMRRLAVGIVREDYPEFWEDEYDNSCGLHDSFELKLLLSCCELGDVVELRDSFLKDMEKLNLLEFTNSRVALSQPSSTTQLDQMRNLGTLCLHSCCLEDISKIGELKGLQILSFRGSHVCRLPIELRELIVLKILDLSDCKGLSQIEPNVLGSLTKLEELNMENSFKDWEIDDAPPSNARLIELKNMSRLSNVRIHIPSTSMLPKDGQLFSSKLTTYQIMFGVARKKKMLKYCEDRRCYKDFSKEYIKFSRVLMLTFDTPDILWQDWVQATLQTAEVLYISGHLEGKCESISEMCIKGFECLKHLRMRNCPSVRFISSSNDASSSNLESLFLENLENLEKLCGEELPRQDEAFKKLRVVKIDYCNKLTHLFDFSLLKGRLSSQLEEITIEKCARIQCIVADEGDNNCDVVSLSKLQKLEFRRLCKLSSFCVGPSSNVKFTGKKKKKIRHFDKFSSFYASNALFNGKKVAFPRLESLIIERVDKLEEIWHPIDPPAELGNLRLLQVESCNKLVRAINSNVSMRLQQHLESLSIDGCKLMKEVIDVEHGINSTDDDDDHDLVLFSRLKELRLRDMKGLEGVYNNNKNLMMMMMKGGRSMKIFPNIESLNVSQCPHLRYVLCCSFPTTTRVGEGGGGYEDLKEIKIEHCRGMEAIVDVMIMMVDQETQQPAHHQQIEDYDAVSYSYSSLNEMKISRCPKLRTFCHYLLSSEQDYAAQGLPFFSQKEIFPCLESLCLVFLSNKLEEIWGHEVPPQNSFSMLKQVSIYGFPEVSAVFPSTLIARLKNLTSINVGCCVRVMQIILVNEEEKGNCESETCKEEIFFHCLTTLLLSYLPNLDRFYSSSSPCSFQFPCLETLEIMSCGRVKTLLVDDGVGALFKSCHSLAIPNLKSLTLWDFENLTNIWKGETHDDDQGLIIPNLESLTLVGFSSYCGNLQSLLPNGVAASSSFCNVLTKLTVQSCKGLEYLLTPVGATSLMHLTYLSIENCFNMKEVVAEEAASDMITFSHLKELKLYYLPSLEKFSSVVVLNFPSLEKLDIQWCLSMVAFSSGIATASTPMFGDLNSFVQKNIENITKTTDRLL